MSPDLSLSAVERPPLIDRSIAQERVSGSSPSTSIRDLIDVQWNDAKALEGNAASKDRASVVRSQPALSDLNEHVV